MTATTITTITMTTTTVTTTTSTLQSTLTVTTIIVTTTTNTNNNLLFCVYMLTYFIHLIVLFMTYCDRLDRSPAYQARCIIAGHQEIYIYYAWLIILGLLNEFELEIL